MNEYILSVIAVSAVVTLGSLIRYGGALDKTATAAMSVILLCVTVTPIIELVGSISELSSEEMLSELSVSEKLDGSEYYGTAKEAFCSGIEKYICEEFSLNKEEVKASVLDFDVQKMRAGKINILLSGSAVTADARSIKNRIESEGLGECEVNFDFTG